MENFMKRNTNIIIALFILISPIIDLLTGVCLHYFHIQFTIGAIIRTLFLIFICFASVFAFRKKKLLIPYCIGTIYCLCYIIGIVLYKDGELLIEIQNLIKVMYFPILLVSLYSIKQEIKLSKLLLFATLLFYLVFIFIPTLFNIGYKTYEVTKIGTLGFFNSANEIGGIISILTPILFYILTTSKKNVLRIIILGIYLSVILMMGTKTPLLIFIMTLGLSIIYLFIKYLQQKEYKKIIISSFVTFIGIITLLGILPETNFYKNIKTHLKFLKIKDVTEIIEKEEYVDHFVFSQRLTFLKEERILYQQANNYQKLFGIGYLNNGKETKRIEMDYFDIYYSHGIVGFILISIAVIWILYELIKVKMPLTYENYMMKTSLFYIFILSFFTGHIITTPSVSLIASTIIILLFPKEKTSILVIGKEAKKNQKNYEIKYQAPIKRKIDLLIFKIMNYKSYNYSYSEEKKNIELASIASNCVLNKKEYNGLLAEKIKSRKDGTS